MFYKTKHYKYVYKGKSYYRGDIVIPLDNSLKELYKDFLFAIDDMWPKEGLVCLEVCKECENGSIMPLYEISKKGITSSYSTKFTLSIDDIKPFLRLDEKLDILLNDD